MLEMEQENEQLMRFPGYFSGVNANWKQEYCVKPTGSDEFRGDIEKEQIRQELEMRTEGVIFQDPF